MLSVKLSQVTETDSWQPGTQAQKDLSNPTHSHTHAIKLAWHGQTYITAPHPDISQIKTQLGL